MRGLILAMPCSLPHIAWQRTNPATTLTHDGSAVSLLVVSPVVLKSRV